MITGAAFIDNDYLTERSSIELSETFFSFRKLYQNYYTKLITLKFVDLVRPNAQKYTQAPI